jgi:hypothetical protein
MDVEDFFVHALAELLIGIHDDAIVDAFGFNRRAGNLAGEDPHFASMIS